MSREDGMDVLGRGTGGGEGGFALLVSLIAIVGLTALATGGFFLANAERQMSSNHHAAMEAFHVANAGLSQFMGSVSGSPADAAPVSIGFGTDVGWADVTATRVGTARGGEELYRISSQGNYDPNATGTPVTRTVSRVVVLNESVVPSPPAAITSGGGITKNGSAGTISGVDRCGQQSDRAGVRVPSDPGYTQQGGGEVLEGDPPADSVANPFDFLGDGEAWWNSALDGTLAPHDHVIDGGTDWPEFGESEMPVTFVDQESVQLGDAEDGRGLLIVRGNATFKGNFDWEGIILVGGSVTDHGRGQIVGGVMTGLNTLIGEDVGQDDLEDLDRFDGTKKYLFDSCVIEQVQSSLATVAGVQGTWYEEL